MHRGDLTSAGPEARRPWAPRPGAGMPRAGRRTWRSGALVAVVIGVLGLWAAPAFAHASLVDTVPAPGSVVIDPPTAIVLRFSEPVTAGLGGVELYDAAGARRETAAPVVAGDTVRVPVRATLGDGSYVVTWRVVSADTHPVDGAFTFSVGKAAGPNESDPSILADRLLRDQHGDATVGATWAVVRWLTFLAIALVVGGLVFLVGVWPRARTATAARRLVVVAWAFLVVVTVVGLAVQGPYASAQGLGKALDPGLWGDVARSRFGGVWLGRLGLLAVLAVLLRRLLASRGGTPQRLPTWWTVATAVVTVGIAATPALSGHASAGALVPLTVLAATVHVLALSVWLGGPGLAWRVVGGGDEPAAPLPVVERFSRLAFWCVMTLIVTGAYQAWRELRALANVRDTDFGRILVVKLAVFALMVVVAAFSREIVHRLFRPAGDPGEPDPGDSADDGPDPEARRREWRALRRSVWAEAAIGLAVLAATAALVNAVPATGVGAQAAEGAVGVTLRSSTVAVDVTLTPGRAGPNDVHISVFTPAGAPRDVQQLTMTFDLASRGIAPIDVPLRRLGPGHYLSPGFTVPFPGTWRITAKALLTDVDLTTLVGKLAIG